MKRPESSLISDFSNRVKKEGGINLAQGPPGFSPLVVQGETEGIFLTFFYLTTFLERLFSALFFDPVYEKYGTGRKSLNWSPFPGYTTFTSFSMLCIRIYISTSPLSIPSLLIMKNYFTSILFGKNYIAAIKGKCKKSYDFMKKAVTLLGFDVKEGRGRYFLWAKLPPPRTDAFTFALELYNNVQVAVVPGENFSRTKYNYIRVNIGTGMPVIREAVLRIKGFFI